MVQVIRWIVWADQEGCWIFEGDRVGAQKPRITRKMLDGRRSSDKRIITNLRWKFIKRENKILKLSFFLGRDLGYFLFFLVKIMFSFFFLFLKFFFYKFPPLGFINNS